MKSHKKLILSTALLALLGVGLAGCGNQQSAQKSNTQQKAEQPKESSKDQKLEEANDIGRKLQAVQVSKKYTKNISGANAPMEPGQPETVAINNFDGGSEFTNHVTPQKAKTISKAFWSQFRPKAIKAVGHKSVPVEFIYNHDDLNKDGKVKDLDNGGQQKHMLIYKANINSPKLHYANMKSITTD